MNNTLISDKSFFVTDSKKNRVIRNKAGKEVKIDPNNMNPNVRVDDYPSVPKNQQE